MSRTQLAKGLLLGVDSRQVTLLIPQLIKKSRQNLTVDEERELGLVLTEISASNRSPNLKNFEYALLLINYLGEDFVQKHQSTLKELSVLPEASLPEEEEPIEIEVE